MSQKFVKIDLGTALSNAQMSVEVHKNDQYLNIKYK